MKFWYSLSMHSEEGRMTKTKLFEVFSALDFCAHVRIPLELLPVLKQANRIPVQRPGEGVEAMSGSAAEEECRRF